MQIVEFKDRYPNYNMGFFATNDRTETEKLIGLRMHLCFHKQKTYQDFWIPENYYNQILERVIDCKSNEAVHMQINNANFIVVYRDECIKGICLETSERVMFSIPLDIIIG